MGGLFSRSETKAGNQLLRAPKLDVVGYDKAFGLFDCLTIIVAN
jgi:hypothetical protein